MILVPRLKISSSYLLLVTLTCYLFPKSRDSRGRLQLCSCTGKRYASLGKNTTELVRPSCDGETLLAAVPGCVWRYTYDGFNFIGSAERPAEMGL